MSPEKMLEIMMNVPKQYIEDLIVGFNSECVYMATRSGQNVTGFAMSPEQAKRLLQNLKDKVEGFEKSHRSLNTEWSKNPPSPIQISDLKLPPQEGAKN